MTEAVPVVYTDDPDAHWTFTITDGEGGTLDWASPAVAARGGDYTLAATWLGDPGSTRRLRVPLADLAAGSYALYLKVPGGNDFRLGTVWVTDRT